MSYSHQQTEQRLDDAWFGARTDAELFALCNYPESARRFGIRMPKDIVTARARAVLEGRARELARELERQQRKHEWYRTTAMLASAILVAWVTVILGG